MVEQEEEMQAAGAVRATHRRKLSCDERHRLQHLRME
jgi:hypothetical protein